MRNNEKLYSVGLTSISLVLFLIVISTTTSASTEQSTQFTINETPISTNGSWQHFPKIYNDRVVWEDHRNGWENADVYMYNLSTSTETQITTDKSNQLCPAIYGDKIVWVDYRAGNPAIYMYDLSTSKETYIGSASYDTHPAIYADKIVWHDGTFGGPNIYMYNISTSKKIQISTRGFAYSPAIYEDKIVWASNNIYMYDISTSKETQITTNKSDLLSPVIYGDRIIWMGRNGMGLIGKTYMYDLSTNNQTQIIINGSLPVLLGLSGTNFGIYGDTLVWSDNRDGNWDIYMENLTTLKETHIVTNGAYQGGPAIYGNKIVWMDNRNGNYDIYMGTLVSNILNANFSAVPISGSIPLKVSFTDKSVGSISSWEWSFGDGTISTEQNPTHMYSTDGNYTVNLTVRDGNGIDSKLATIEVLPTAILPVIFSYKNPPTDPNHDGRYEDVNGNGVQDFDDVVAYYDNMDWIADNSQVALFDYNNNNLIDFDDVVKIYDML